MTHTMTLTTTLNGVETWYCPTCGRTLHITWDPWKRVVVAAGDDTVQHAGTKGDLVLDVEQSDPYLEPFMKYFDRKENGAL